MILINNIKKIIIIFILLGFLTPFLSSAQNLPENPDEIKQAGEKALQVSKNELPGLIKEKWKSDVMPTLKKMFDWFKINIWPKIWPPARQELEKRKEIFKQEFPAEKQEVKEETPGLIKSLWERFKDIIK